jgi:uncharacterized membrane protein
MPALYVVLVVVSGWMALATWGPLRGTDPYPFAFLLFLNNVVQLVLCSVILVGQRVLGVAADRRAVQTYESAETIFDHVSELQEHLDRHDQALSQGVSLLQASPHPWIQRHRVQPPPQAIDHAVSLNGRLAAWLTQRLGSMWAFYAAAVTQVVWIGLAELGWQSFDPYPFAFMTFLSSLVQLIFMIVIMVGQDVLGRAADRRSQQTFLDAEAILHECRRMKARLTAQDRIIDSLTGYTTTQVIEGLARAIHDADRHPSVRRSHESDGVARTSPSVAGWEELSEALKESARAQARHLGETLAAIGCLMVPAFDATLNFMFADEEVQLLARSQHQRHLAATTDRERDNPPATSRDPDPNLVLWEDLSEHVQANKMQTIRDIPTVLASVGFQVIREGGGIPDGPGQANFTTDEWATLQRALMASGVLVSMAVGEIDPEEMFELVRKLREASVAHPRRLIRELAATSTFDRGVKAGTRYHDYQQPALATIRSATAIVARKAPSELGEFRAFLVEIAEVVADANNEGGFFGLGARPRTPVEAAVIEAVDQATQYELPIQTAPVTVESAHAHEPSRTAADAPTTPTRT